MMSALISEVITPWRMNSFNSVSSYWLPGGSVVKSQLASAGDVGDEV